MLYPIIPARRHWLLAAIVLAAAVVLLASADRVVLAQDPTPTATPPSVIDPTPTPTSPPVPTNTPAPTDTPAPTATPTLTPTPTATPPPTHTPEPTWTPAPTWTPVPTSTPPPTATPVPTETPVPVQRPTVPGGPVFINCGSGEPCIDLHSSHTTISVDDTAQLSFSLSNALSKPQMIARLTLEMPSGWSMDGEGFANKCSGICTANYTIATGDQRYIEMSAYPNHTGLFRLEGRVEFVYAGEQDSNLVTQDVRIQVNPGPGGNQNRTQPLPTSPPPVAPPAVPPVAPAAAQPAAPTSTPEVIIITQPAPPPIVVTATPSQPPVGVSAGCFAPPPESAGVVEPSLLLLLGLLVPVGLGAKLRNRIGNRIRNRIRNWRK